MSLIVNGDILPTDKPILAFLHHSGEIHKVVAKNGDVIWEMLTKLPKGGKMKLDSTHYWFVTAQLGDPVPNKVVWDGQIISLTHKDKFRVTVGEVNYVRGNKFNKDPNTGSRKYELVKVMNGYSYYHNADGAEKIYWREYGSPVDKIGIQSIGKEFFITDPTEVTNAQQSKTYEKNGYRYYRGDFVERKNSINYYYVGRVKL